MSELAGVSVTAVAAADSETKSGSSTFGFGNRSDGLYNNDD